MRTLSPRLSGALVAAAVLAASAFALTSPTPVAAQAPPPTEEQAAAVERQLLCPICTNERLDVCSIAICDDMKRIIRERLAAGSTPDDIILYFETRYGERVRADLRAEGFNLWLYGWIGASMLAVAGLGAWFLLSLRHRGRPAIVTSAPVEHDPVDDRWLDEQLAEDAPPDGERR